MTDYTAKASSAKRMLASFGKYGYIKLSRFAGVHDPVAGTNTGTYSDIDLYAVDLDINKSLLNDGLVKATDRMVIMSSDAEPSMPDTISIGSVDHKIINIVKISPSGTDVIYKVVCRA